MSYAFNTIFTFDESNYDKKYSNENFVLMRIFEAAIGKTNEYNRLKYDSKPSLQHRSNDQISIRIERISICGKENDYTIRHDEIYLECPYFMIKKIHVIYSTERLSIMFEKDIDIIQNCSIINNECLIDRNKQPELSFKKVLDTEFKQKRIKSFHKFSS